MWLRFMCLWSQTGDISNSQVTIFAPHSNRSKGVNRCHFPQAINLASVVSPCHHLCVGIPLASIGETYFCEDGAEDWFFGGKRFALFEGQHDTWIKQVNEVTKPLCDAIFENNLKQFFSTSSALGDISTFRLRPRRSVCDTTSVGIAIQAGDPPRKILDGDNQRPFKLPLKSEIRQWPSFSLSLR